MFKIDPILYFFHYLLNLMEGTEANKWLKIRIANPEHCTNTKK
jgi:hypothetical protein